MSTTSSWLCSNYVPVSVTAVGCRGTCTIRSGAGTDAGTDTRPPSTPTHHATPTTPFHQQLLLSEEEAAGPSEVGPRTEQRALLLSCTLGAVVCKDADPSGIIAWHGSFPRFYESSNDAILVFCEC